MIKSEVKCQDDDPKARRHSDFSFALSSVPPARSLTTTSVECHKVCKLKLIVSERSQEQLQHYSTVLSVQCTAKTLKSSMLNCLMKFHSRQHPLFSLSNATSNHILSQIAKVPLSRIHRRENGHWRRVRLNWTFIFTFFEIYYSYENIWVFRSRFSPSVRTGESYFNIFLETGTKTLDMKSVG